MCFFAESLVSKDDSAVEERDGLVWGMGVRGKGQRPSLAQRFRSCLHLAEPETLTAIVNRDVARFILPPQHATFGWRPVLTLPFPLQHRLL